MNKLIKTFAMLCLAWLLFANSKEIKIEYKKLRIEIKK